MRRYILDIGCGKVDPCRKVENIDWILEPKGYETLH